jgi:hypothetical protein
MKFLSLALQIAHGHYSNMSNKSAGFIVPHKNPSSSTAHLGTALSGSLANRGQGATGLGLIEPSLYIDSSTKELMDRIQALKNPPSLTSLISNQYSARGPAKTIEEQLFDATASVKTLTSQVAMYLDREWRDRLFQQLDSLHDPDEWETDDTPLQQASFATFLKAIFQIKPSVRPGLGLTNGGNLIAAWTVGKNRLTIEFLPNDRVRWVISRFPDGEMEQFAGQTPVSRLVSGLKPYSPEQWLYKC